MDDIELEGGFAVCSPKRKRKKRNGEYVISKEAVEYHGLRRLYDLEDEAHWAMNVPEVDEDKEEEADEDEKPKKTKSKGFGFKKNTKTTYIK